MSIMDTAIGTALARERWRRSEHIRQAERARKLVERWPDLTPEQAATIRAILAPVLAQDPQSDAAVSGPETEGRRA